MIESMVEATARNIAQLIEGTQPTHKASWNAICLADFGDGGVAFVAQPQIPLAMLTGRLPGMGTLGQGGIRKVFPTQAANRPV